MKAEFMKASTTTSLPNPSLFQYSSPLPSSASSSSALGGDLNLQGCVAIGPTPAAAAVLDASCVEKLLLHCAAALEANDTTVAQQVMWVLNNVAVPDGNPNQRLTSSFLKALIARAARLCLSTAVPLGAATAANLNRNSTVRLMAVTELAGYIDLTPWHRFGFSASNGAILQAIQGRTKIHIIDFGITYCMQWPTLIDSLSKRPEGPPLRLRITVPATRPAVPPMVSVSIQTIGLRLTNFAKSRNLSLEFNVANPNANPSLDPAASLDIRHDDNDDDEAVVVNCHSWLRYVPNKDEFLESVRELNPSIVTVTDEDVDLDSPSLTSRILTCFNYFWIPFDAVETFLPKDSPQRAEYEADVGHKIGNVIGHEGEERVERSESGARIARRMKRAGFASVGFGEETLREVKWVLDEHASGWGMKRDEDMIVLTWKGHSSVFTAAWVPN